MAHNLTEALSEYCEYASLFAAQLYDIETWSEQTGCEVDEFVEYLTCCGHRLFSFSTWYEHSKNEEYPKGGKWDEYADFKESMFKFVR